jgi:YegS/Rv2252/BmrU family lipid kinase
MSRPAAVLLNCSSRSRRAAERRDRLAEIIASSRLSAELYCAEDGAELAAMARRFAEGHYELIIAAGGDGTVNAVASAIAGTSKVLGVLPLGTVNHFARNLGVPLDLARAVDRLVEAEHVWTDVGEVNGRVFVNNSTLGVYPRIVRFREQLRLRYGVNKWIAFAYAAARMLPRRDPLKIRLRADGGEEIQAITPFVFIGRSDTKLGALDLVPGQQPAPGKLSICIVRAGGRLAMLRLASRAVVGRLSSADGVEVFQAATLHIEADVPRLHVAMDGEVVALPPPLEYRVRPRALRVAVPRIAAQRVEQGSVPPRPHDGPAGREKREEAQCVR